MSLHLLLVRRAETPWTLAGRAQGCTSVPPAPEALDRIRATADELKAFAPEDIYAPPDDPGRATGRALRAALGLPLWLRPELRALDMGAWEGLHWDEVQSRFGRAWRRWRADPRIHAPPVGETTLEAAERLRLFAEELLARGTCAVVTADARLLDVLTDEVLPGAAEKPATADPSEASESADAIWTEYEVVTDRD